jgi:hypothetical protein
MRKQALNRGPELPRRHLHGLTVKRPSCQVVVAPAILGPLLCAILCVALSVAGCATRGNDGGFGDGVLPDGGTSPGSNPNGPGGSFGPNAGGDAGSAPSTGKTLLYAHTDTTLYRLDADNVSAPMVKIGDFDCVGKGQVAAMTDIAVAKDGKLFGVSDVAAYPLSLQGGAVHCDAVWTLPANARFYGLTVAPENTVAAAEVLIGANSAGELYQIDPASGATTQVGTLGKDAKGLPNELSGDIVFLANAGAPVGFATVRSCVAGKTGKPPTCSDIDTLIEVDVKAVRPGTQSVLKSTRGQVKKGAWCKNAASPPDFGGMFGITAFKDKVFGFSRKGAFIEVHNDDGTGCLITEYTSEKFAGAGVTTAAPVTAPR